MMTSSGSALESLYTFPFFPSSQLPLVAALSISSSSQDCTTLSTTSSACFVHWVSELVSVTRYSQLADVHLGSPHAGRLRSSG